MTILKWYECPDCGFIVEVKDFWKWSFIPNIFDKWRHLRCPHCGEKRRMKKIKDVV